MSDASAHEYLRPAARRARSDLARYALIEPPTPPEDDQGGWLMSYLDVLTLLITLFVLLLALRGDPAPVEAPISASSAERPLPTLAADSAFWQLLGDSGAKQAIRIPLRATGPADNTSAVPTVTNDAATLAPPSVKAVARTAALDQGLSLAMTVAALQLPQAVVAGDDDAMARWAAAVPGIDGVVVEPGERHVTFRIQDRLLFSSADTELSDNGRQVLDRLAQELADFDGEISVEGHTDSRTIATERFPSNWELSAARATAVLHYLADHGVTAEQMRAIGYGATRPLAVNDTATSRAKNRRVELVLRPGEAGTRFQRIATQ